jgi:hypothetical protein
MLIRAMCVSSPAGTRGFLGLDALSEGIHNVDNVVWPRLRLFRRRRTSRHDGRADEDETDEIVGDHDAIQHIVLFLEAVPSCARQR